MRPVFDGHNDALTREGCTDLAAAGDGGHLDLPRMREGGMRGGIFAIFTPNPEEAATHAPAVAERLADLERREEVLIARSIADVDAALTDSAPPAAVMHIEGAEAIDPGLAALAGWYARGLRSLGPVWSRSNAFGHGVPFAFPSSPDTGPGLTEPGTALVGACAELGILVDLSHMNEAGFWDVARIEPGPLVASHSGAHALSPASRNLTDAQIDAIGATEGLVGIVFAPPFLRPDAADDADTPLALIAEHAGYVADRIGPEHVALGSDFDGATVPAELGDVAGLQKLVAALEAGGFSTEETAAICWHNWRRVLDAWWR
jgi:membrane dipeptidase